MKRRNFIKTTAIGTAGIGMLRLYACDPRIDRFSDGRYCIQPGADIPVIADVDVLVTGGALGGVVAALSAAQKGAKVFLVSYQPYLGEDLCGTYRYMFNRPDTIGDSWLENLLPPDEPPSSMRIKTKLEKELIENGIDFLYSSYVADVVFDDRKNPAGVVINNRTGRQAILAKTIVDCTQGAWVSRLAGATFVNTIEDETMQFGFVAAGNEEKSIVNVSVSKMPVSLKTSRADYSVLSYEFNHAVKNFDFKTLALAEQIIRNKTFDIEQVDSADQLHWVQPYRLRSRLRGNDGQDGGDQENLIGIHTDAFIPRGMDGMITFSTCADLSKDRAARLTEPAMQLLLGRQLGQAAAEEAANLYLEMRNSFYTRPVKGIVTLSGVTGEVSELMRPNLGNRMLRVNETAVPVIEEVDVLVAGGGTAGAPAAIGAARQGSRTLVVEYLHGLGGTGTLGMIGRYWYGHREGFTSEIDREVKRMAAEDHPRQRRWQHEWPIDWKMEWYRREIRKAGGEIWFGVMATGAFVQDGQVKGVLVATPEGRGVILAKQIIDATGSADVAIAAGAGYEYVDGESVAVQGSGLPKVDPDDHYNNTDWTFVDESDVFDTTRVLISGKQKFQGVFDIGKLPQTRERRRVVADFMVSPIDMMAGRRYPDTISFHKSNFDTHGYTIHPYFIIRQPDGGHVTYDVDLPLRCLLPRGLTGIFVTGLGAGAHRDAMPVIRMQPCLQNQGYAVGWLAAELVSKGISDARKTDVKDLQRHLVEIGSLPERVLTDTDNFPLPDSMFTEALAKIGNNFEGMEILFSDIDRGKTFLQRLLHQEAPHNDKLHAAIILGVLGIGTGWNLIAKAIDEFDAWDEGWNFTGMGQFGFSLSRLDTLVIALGRCKRSETLKTILAKAELLKPGHHFSHYRAVCIALETMANREAAPVLFRLLNTPGVSGHHVITRTDAVSATVPGTEDVSLRNNVLRELHLARALYRCGDHYGLGRQILENYASDLHGHYFRHATGVLGLTDNLL